MFGECRDHAVGVGSGREVHYGSEGGLVIRWAPVMSDGKVVVRWRPVEWAGRTA